MAGYLILTYVLRNVPLKIILPISVIISLLAGYADFMGNFLCLSRFIVFFPFFFTGYCLSPEKVQNFLKRKFVRITGILSLIVLGVTFIILNDYVSPILRPMFYSRFPYSECRFTEAASIHYCDFCHFRNRRNSASETYKVLFQCRLKNNFGLCNSLFCYKNTCCNESEYNTCGSFF